MEISRSTYIYCLCACLNSCNLGYDIGIGTQAGRLIQDDLGLTRVQRELFVGSIDFWAMFGALSAQYVSDTYGRRKTFLVAATGFIFGVVITGIAQTYSVLMLGRMLVGLGVGVGLAIDPLYIAEISPAKHRGELVTWSEIALNVGIVLGFSMSIILAPIADGTEWRWMFFAGTIMPIVMIALVLKVMPESPRWLVSKGQETEAFEILQTIYPKGYDVDLVVHDMKEAYVRDRAVEHAAGWQIIWNPTPAFRRILLVGIGVAVAQQAVGIDSIQYYLLDVLEKSGINSEQKQNLLLIFLGMVKLLFIVVGGKLFDINGRRPLLFISLIGMAIALLMISITFFIASSTSSGFIIFGLGMYLAAFSVGMGPGGLACSGGGLSNFNTGKSDVTVCFPQPSNSDTNGLNFSFNCKCYRVGRVLPFAINHFTFGSRFLVDLPPRNQGALIGGYVDVFCRDYG
jgi:sugar porter (SP) family MFS transporter